MRSWKYHPISEEYLWVQFLKKSPQASGETSFLEKSLSVPVYTVNTDISLQSYQQRSRESTKKIHDQLLQFWNNRDELSSRFYRLIVFDEVLDVLQTGPFNAKQLLSWIKKLPADDIILTGHARVPELLEHADYITQFILHRHPFQNNVPPRKGIEF